jgi:WD40 repeat protein
MRRGWKVMGAVMGAAALAGVGLGGCKRGGGVLDPGGAVLFPDGGSIDAVGGAGSGDGGAGAASAADGGGGGVADGVRRDAGTGATDAGAVATEAGTTTQPPTSACAMMLPGRPGTVAPPPPSANVGVCGASFRANGAMSRAPAAVGQRYTRCGTVGPETSWRVTLSPDASHLAARTSSGTVRLYRTESWVEIAQIASPVGTIDAIAFSPDGNRLAAISSEMGQVTLWNVADGTLAASFDGPVISTIGMPASALAFSSDGRRLATSLGTVIDLPTRAITTFGGRPASSYAARVNPAGATDGLGLSTYDLRFVGCDQRLLVHNARPQGMLGWIGSLSLVDPVSGASTTLASGSWARVGSVVASPAGRFVAFVQYGDAKIGVHLYDAADAKLVAFDPTQARFLAGFSPGGDQLFVVTDTAIQVREVPTYRLLAQSKLPLANPPVAAAVSPRGEVIVSTGSESIWIDPATGAVRRREVFPIAQPSFSADGRYGASDGTGAALFQLWREDDTSVRCEPAADVPATGIAGMALSPDGRTLALADLAGTVQLHAVGESGDIGPAGTRVVTGAAADANDISISVANGGRRVAVLGRPLTVGTVPNPGMPSRVVVVDTADGRPLLARDVDSWGGRVALSPDGAWVAFQDGSYPDRVLTAISVDTGATTLSLPAGSVGEFASFSPDSKRLAVAMGSAMSGGMAIWDLATGLLTTTYALDGSSVNELGLSPDWSVMAGVVSTIPHRWEDQVTLIWHPQDGSVVSQIGRYTDMQGPPTFDASNAIVAAFLHVTHTLSTDWYAWRVWSVADGAELRMFTTSNGFREPLLALPGGSQLLTRAGTALARWCR